MGIPGAGRCTRGNGDLRRGLAVAASLAVLTASPVHGAAQATPAPAPAGPPPDTLSSLDGISLAPWGDATWLLLGDREAAVGVEGIPRGFLARFHPRLDGEFAMDQRGTSFSLYDDRVWERSENGLRYASGSVNHRFMADGADLKVHAPVAGDWGIGVRYTRLSHAALQRDLLRAEVTWRPGRHRVRLGTSLQPSKPERDLWLGWGWRGPEVEVDVSLHALDAFNDAIFQGLGVNPRYADTTTDYRAPSVGLRTSGAAEVGGGTRVAWEVGHLLSGAFERSPQAGTGTGFSQDDDFTLVGVVVERRLGPRLRAGVLGTSVRTVQERTPLASPANDAGAPTRIEEVETRGGIFATSVPAPGWRVHLVGGREWRGEERGSGGDTTDYRDRAWWSTLAAERRLGARLRGVVAWDLDFREVTAGNGTVPAAETLDQDNHRLRFEVRVASAHGVRVDLGVRLDLDGDPLHDRNRFDGAHGRIVILW